MKHNRYLNLSWLMVLLFPMILIVSGCATNEVRLWPILDVTPGHLDQGKPNGTLDSGERGHGKRVRALWPVFELDTTGREVKHAIRPLYSYDGETNEGSVIWPFVRFRFAGKGDHYFHFFPFYFTGQNGENSWKILIPVAGKLDDQKTGDWFFIFPYISWKNGDQHLRGVLTPPLLFGKDRANDSDWGLLLNYFYSKKPGKTRRAFIPFFLKRSTRLEASAESPNTDTFPKNSEELFVFPFYFHRVVEDESERLHSTFYLGPLYQRLWDPKYQKRAFGLVPWIDFDDLHLTSLVGWSSKNQKGIQKKTMEIFPLFSFERGGPEFKYTLPGLGLSRWSHAKSHMGVSGPNRGWAWWPIIGRAQGYNDDYRNPNEWFGWRSLAGLVRYSKNKSRHELSLFFPFHEIAKTETKRHHRFWPLYRYTSTEGTTSFSALAEIFSSRRTSELSSDFRFLLHPISYQHTESGDYDLRFLWKLLEFRSVEGESTRSLNPLFYRIKTSKKSRSLFLGGLFGWGRDGEERFTRLFWFLDI